jgi:hypothetical protein
MTASIKGRLRKEKEKICIAMFSPNGMQQASRLHCSIARRLQTHHGPRIATPSSIGCSADVVQRQLLASVF